MIELNAEAIYRDFAAKVIDLVGRRKVRLVGIHTGGVWLAERLRDELKIEHPVGVLDVSFYRDDFASGGLAPDVKPSRIPFEVAGQDLLLVDDVLYTGRTTRAAMNELFDYGRPARIDLAVLVDRGGRELPIAAQVIGRTLEVPADISVVLTRDDDLKFHLTLEEQER